MTQVTARFIYTPEDYLEVQTFYRERVASWSQRYNPKFVFVGGLLMAGLGIAMFFAHSDKFLAVACAVFGFYIALWNGLLPAHRSRRAFRRETEFKNEYVATIDENEVQFSSSNRQSRFQWTAFSRWVETPNLFLFFYGPKHFIYIPKRLFSAAEQETVRQMLAEKIGSAKTQ